jgi:hypothetical protein
LLNWLHDPEKWEAASSKLRSIGLLEVMMPAFVIASDSEAIHGHKHELDCFVARAPRNDDQKRSQHCCETIPSRKTTAS